MDLELDVALDPRLAWVIRTTYGYLSPKLVTETLFDGLAHVWVFKLGFRIDDAAHTSSILQRECEGMYKLMFENFS